MIVWTTLGQLGQAPPCGLTMADGDANCVTIWWETHFHTTLVKHCAEHTEIHLNRVAPYCAVPVFTYKKRIVSPLGGKTMPHRTGSLAWTENQPTSKWCLGGLGIREYSFSDFCSSFFTPISHL